MHRSLIAVAVSTLTLATTPAPAWEYGTETLDDGKTAFVVTTRDETGTAEFTVSCTVHREMPFHFTLAMPGPATDERTVTVTALAGHAGRRFPARLTGADGQRMLVWEEKGWGTGTAESWFQSMFAFTISFDDESYAFAHDDLSNFAAMSTDCMWSA